MLCRTRTAGQNARATPRSPGRCLAPRDKCGGNAAALSSDRKAAHFQRNLRPIPRTAELQHCFQFAGWGSAWQVPGLLAAKGIEGMHKRHMLAVLLNLRRCIAEAFSCKLTDPEGQDPLCLVFTLSSITKVPCCFWDQCLRARTGWGCTVSLVPKPSTLNHQT